jgi:Fe-S cluster assembly ATP-binding protein
VRGLTASVKETGQQILAGVDLTIREGEVRVGSSCMGCKLIGGLLCIA